MHLRRNVSNKLSFPHVSYGIKANVVMVGDCSPYGSPPPEYFLMFIVDSESDRSAQRTCHRYLETNGIGFDLARRTRRWIETRHTQQGVAEQWEADLELVSPFWESAESYDHS